MKCPRRDTYTNLKARHRDNKRKEKGNPSPTEITIRTSAQGRKRQTAEYRRSRA